MQIRSAWKWTWILVYYKGKGVQLTSNQKGTTVPASFLHFRKIKGATAVVIFACALLLQVPIAAGSRPQQSAGPRPRLLVFPEHQSLGRLTLLEHDFDAGDRHLTGKPYRECQGQFAVPPNLTLFLVANDALAQHPEILLEMPPDSFAAATFEHTTLADGGMAAIGHLTGLRYLSLDNTETSDMGLSKLAGLSALAYLELGHTLTKGECLAKFGGMKKLAFVNLSSNDIDPRCLNSLVGLPLLHEVWLGQAGLHDGDLAYLARLKGLKRLSLKDDRDITDQGVKLLAACKHLEWLDVRGTMVSGKGVLALKSLPLNTVKISGANVSDADARAIKAMFPGIGLILKSKGDTIPREMFAPLH